MEFKGTKGEWKVDLSSLQRIYISSKSVDRGVCLIERSLKKEIHEEQVNTAKLIAAAPELLDALTMLIEETEDYENNSPELETARLKAELAIKKALGHGE